MFLPWHGETIFLIKRNYIDPIVLNKLLSWARVY